jgi:hypothetical protein
MATFVPAWLIEAGLSRHQAEAKSRLLQEAGIPAQIRQVGPAHEIWMDGMQELASELDDLLPATASS